LSTDKVVEKVEQSKNYVMMISAFMQLKEAMLEVVNEIDFTKHINCFQGSK
jgi:hypothetical protein